MGNSQQCRGSLGVSQTSPEVPRQLPDKIPVDQKGLQVCYFGHFLRGRSLKGRCDIRMYVPLCACVFLCVSLRSPPDPAHTVGLNSRIPPHTHTRPLTPVPASVPASNCVTYPWEELPLKKCLITVSGGAIQTLAWVRSWARPGPILGPKGSRPDSPCALFYSISDPSRSRGGGHPGPS